MANSTSRGPATTRWPWFLCTLAPANYSYSDGPACLICRNSGSLSWHPLSNTRHPRTANADSHDLLVQHPAV